MYGVVVIRLVVTGVNFILSEREAGWTEWPHWLKYQHFKLNSADSVRTSAPAGLNSPHSYWQSAPGQTKSLQHPEESLRKYQWEVEWNWKQEMSMGPPVKLWIVSMILLLHNWLGSDLYPWEQFLPLFSKSFSSKQKKVCRLDGGETEESVREILFWTWPDYKSLMRHCCSQAILIFASVEFSSQNWAEVDVFHWAFLKKRVNRLTLVTLSISTNGSVLCLTEHISIIYVHRTMLSSQSSKFNVTTVM